MDNTRTWSNLKRRKKILWIEMGERPRNATGIKKTAFIGSCFAICSLFLGNHFLMCTKSVFNDSGRKEKTKIKDFIVKSRQNSTAKLI